MSKGISLSQLKEKFHDGMSIMVGGFLGNGTPEKIIDALVESGVKDLTMIVNDTSYPELGADALSPIIRLKSSMYRISALTLTLLSR